MHRPLLHKSSVVVGLIVATLLVLIEVPGRVTEWVFVSGTDGAKTFEHGWPWVYLDRETFDRNWGPGDPTIYPRDVRRMLPMAGVPWLSVANWRAWESDTQAATPRWHFSGLRAAADLCIGFLVTLAIVAAREFRRRHRRGLFSFRLSDLFAALTAVCLLLGRLVYEYREYHRELPFHNAEREAAWYVWDDDCIAPRWLQRLIGPKAFPDFLWRASEAVISPLESQGPNIITQELSQLRYLRKLDFTVVESAAHFPFSALNDVPQVEEIYLRGELLNESDVEELKRCHFVDTIHIWDIEEVPQELIGRMKTELPTIDLIAERKHEVPIFFRQRQQNQ